MNYQSNKKLPGKALKFLIIFSLLAVFQSAAEFGRGTAVLAYTADPPLLLDVSGSSNEQLFSQVNPAAVPTPQTPAGNISDTTPTYTWTAVAGATKYRFQLRNGGVIYNKIVGSAACAGALCSNTPTNVLPYSSYNWRVQAMINGEWQSWSDLLPFKLVEPFPEPKAPSGIILDTTPGYTWTKVAGATQYRLQLIRGGSTYYVKFLDAGDCGAICETIPANVLPYDSYQWRVQAMKDGQWSTWSNYMNFQVVRPGFVSDFNGDMTGWEILRGYWILLNDAYLYSSGGTQKFNSVQYNTRYPTFSYEALMKRVGVSSEANGLYVRGTPTPFSIDGSWYSGYYFAYSNDGLFSVWKFSSGSKTPLQLWTTTASINQDGWNRLKVIGNGPGLKFYINNTLVWSGTDASFTNGFPGITFYSSYHPGNRLLVDWASLSSTNLTALELDRNEPVESGQIEVGGDSPFTAP